MLFSSSFHVSAKPLSLQLFLAWKNSKIFRFVSIISRSVSIERKKKSHFLYTCGVSVKFLCSNDEKRVKFSLYWCVPKFNKPPPYWKLVVISRRPGVSLIPRFLADSFESFDRKSESNNCFNSTKFYIFSRNFQTFPGLSIRWKKICNNFKIFTYCKSSYYVYKTDFIVPLRKKVKYCDSERRYSKLRILKKKYARLKAFAKVITKIITIT